MNPINNQSKITPQPITSVAAAAASLSLPVDLKQRALQEAATLLEGNPAFVHNEMTIRAFGSMHCTTTIRQTDIEGGHPRIAFDYMQKLLAIYDFPIGHGLNQQQLSALNATDEQLIDMDELVLKNPEKLKDKIAEHCQKSPKKCCYLPFILKHVDLGHYITIKVRLLKDGRYAFSYLNKGLGSQFHDPLLNGEIKNKSDYQSGEFAVDLKSQKGSDLLTYLILFQTDDRILNPKNLVTVKPYCDVELYSLLCFFGERLKGQEQRIGHGVTDQRTAICWIANTRVALDDPDFDTCEASV